MLAAPDLGLTSFKEVLDQVQYIIDAVAVPVIVDADTGFGNAVKPGRVVRLLERAGAAAAQLEDQEFPKRCGHFDGKRVVSDRGDGRQDPGGRRRAHQRPDS